MPNDEIEGYRYALEYALGIPFSGGNRLTALQNGREIFPAMLAA
ncbi:MAG: cardiolipin synthase B, partial [Chromatiales bacterium]